MQFLFRYFNSSPEVIRLAVKMYTCYPLSLRQVEDPLSERGIEICGEIVRFRFRLHRGIDGDAGRIRRQTAGELLGRQRATAGSIDL